MKVENHHNQATKFLTSRCGTRITCAGQFLNRSFVVLLRKSIPQNHNLKTAAELGVIAKNMRRIFVVLPELIPASECSFDPVSKTCDCSAGESLRLQGQLDDGKGKLTLLFEAPRRQRQRQTDLRSPHVDGRAGVCEYHVEQAIKTVQSSRKNESAEPVAIILYDAQYREADAVWRNSRVAMATELLYAATTNRKAASYQ